MAGSETNLPTAPPSTSTAFMTREAFIVWRQAILMILNFYAKKYGVAEK